MVFSDNQTKHFYALNAATDGSDGVLYEVKALANSDAIRVMLYKNATDKTAGKAMATTDIINRKLIKRAKVNEVKPIYYRKWVVNPMSSVSAGKTYRLYFYLENMYGFGIQDRWDLVASHTATSTDTVASVMAALKTDLDGKLNPTYADTPLKNDFTVSVDNSTNVITVAENPNSKTFRQLNEMALRMHDNPYVYDVTLSTYDGDTVWGSNARRILPQNTANVYVSAAQKVQAMELYFLRNRADLYDLTKDFNVSILNETNTNTSATSYYTVDIDYAFSDTQGYTYHSDKQLSIAVPGAANSPYDSAAKTLMNAIVGNTVDSLAAIVNDSTIGNVKLDDRVSDLENA